MTPLKGAFLYTYIDFLALDSLNFGRCKRINIAKKFIDVSKLILLTQAVTIG